MSLGLSILLVVFAAVWFIAIIAAIYMGKISIRYSIVWFFAALVLLIVGLFPGLMEWVAGVFHFELVSNLVAAILITLLMIITFALTLFTTKQKKQINSLIQEVSILKSKLEKNDKRK